MTWKDVIELEKQKDYYKNLKVQIDKMYETRTIFPPKEKIFRAFSLTKLDNLKVVILGQDPYHGFGQAQGLAFSTPANIKNPPSMQNILQEIYDDLQKPSICLDGDLTPWAKQGVLLLNTVLTVQKAKAGSHQNIGWEIFTDNIIKYISKDCKDIIFLLWGSFAIKKRVLIEEKNHHILTAVHPSPLSAYRGFFGCKHFSKANAILKSLAKEPIVW